MIKNIMRLVVASAIAVFAAPIFADGHGCKISARVSIVGNEFPAIHAVADLSLIHISEPTRPC